MGRAAAKEESLSVVEGESKEKCRGCRAESQPHAMSLKSQLYLKAQIRQHEGLSALAWLVKTGGIRISTLLQKHGIEVVGLLVVTS